MFLRPLRRLAVLRASSGRPLSSSAASRTAPPPATAFLPSLFGAPRSSFSFSRAAVAVRWHSAFASSSSSSSSSSSYHTIRQQPRRLDHAASSSSSAFPPFRSVQAAPFSTDRDDAAQRRRAERRRARLRGKAAPTMTKEREQVTGEPVYADDREEGSDPRRQIDAMSDGQAAYLRRVWGLAGANVGIASVGCIGGMVLGISPLISFGGSIVSILALSFAAPKGSNPALRAGLLASTALFVGSSLGPIVGASLAMDPLLLPMALGASGGIFAGATVFSLMAPEGKMLSLGGPLFGGLLVLVGCGVLGMFYPHPVLHSISLYGGLALFTVYVAYDTQVILDDYKNGMEDSVQHSLQLFLDFVNIFRRVLFMFMMTNDD
jgi:FtsH-binding integral membrane protein